MYSNIKVYQKNLGTSIKVGCATRSLYVSAGPKAKVKSFTTFIGIYIARLLIKQRSYRWGRTAYTQFLMSGFKWLLYSDFGLC